MTKPLVLVPLALLATLALAACDPIPTPTTPPVVEPDATTPAPAPTETVAAPTDDFFMRITARMTQADGESLTATLTVYHPKPGAESAPEIAALESCLVYTSTRAEDAAAVAEPAWFGRADLTVTGTADWDQEHAVRIDTGGRGNISTGNAAWFADEITCANLLDREGTSSFATYFPLNYAEGGIEGALMWSTMGFSDQGDAGGVTYDDCAVELSPYAASLSPGDSGWLLHSETFGCYMGANWG